MPFLDDCVKKNTEMMQNDEKYPLSLPDAAILRLLQADASVTLETLAEAAALSTASAWRRVKALEVAGVIVGRVTLADPVKTARALCVFADVSLHDHTPANRDAFERFVATAEDVMECHSTAGGRDYLLKIRVADVAAYEVFLMEHLLAHKAVASATSSFSLRELKYTTALPV